MKKTTINNLDLELFYEKLNNGLEIYIVPKNNSNNTYVTFTTKYGSNNNNFKIGDKLYNMPAGIAHFLEHKMFEQENGVDPFTLFSDNGADANAFTNYNQTTYLFSSPSNFEENMRVLLDFIGKPYFTDKNVEKEKGIIIQELKMYEDNQFRKGFSKIVENAFKNHPVKMQVGGTIESVKKITKEDLYKCYETFYNPSNMFIVITGNVNPDKAIEIIKKNIVEMKKIEFTNIVPDEPDEVSKKEEIIKMNVTIPKVYYGVKINIGNYNMKIFKQYLSLYFDSIFDATSEFSKKMKEKEIIDEDINYYFINTEKHLLVVFGAETKFEKELIKEVMKNLSIIPDKETFERKKKIFISSIIYSSDSIFRVNNMITNSIINNGYFNTDLFNQIKSLNYEEMVDIINNISFDNDLYVLVESKK
mgnify:CR=1 FL=1